MRRRDFLNWSAVWSGWAFAGHRLEPPAGQVSPTYAESVMIDATSPDGTDEVSVRLARFPAQGVGSLWVMAFFGTELYSVVDEDLRLGSVTGPTRVEDPRVAVEVTGRLSARFERTVTGGRLTATVQAAARAHSAMEGLAFLGRMLEPTPPDPEVERLRRGLAPMKKQWGVPQ